MSNETKYRGDSADSFLEAARSDMSGSAAIGYMIMATQSAGLSVGTTRRIKDLMLEKIEYFDEEQAERECLSFA